MAKIRVGIVGLSWGELQIEAFKRAHDYQVVALCDSDLARLQDVAQRQKIAQAFTDYNELIARDDVDLVSIATPPSTHHAIAQSAINAGKHVLVEKPLALNTPDACALLQSAESHGVVHAINLEMRFLPALAYCKELIDEDYLGDLLRVDVVMGIEHPWGVRGSWAADDAQGGGLLMELGGHFIDVLRWWFGDVRAVLASRRTHFATLKFPQVDPTSKKTVLIKKSVTGDDAFWSVLQFERGGEALLNFVTGTRYEMGWTISAYGSLGSLIVQSGQLMGMREGDREIALLPIPKRLELGDNPKDPLMWSMTRLADHLALKIKRAQDLKPFPDFHDGIAVSRIIDAIRQSSQAHAWTQP